MVADPVQAPSGAARVHELSAHQILAAHIRCPSTTPQTAVDIYSSLGAFFTLCARDFFSGSFSDVQGCADSWQTATGLDAFGFAPDALDLFFDVF